MRDIVTILILAIGIFNSGCSNELKNPEQVQGIWTAFESLHDDDRVFTLAFKGNELKWFGYSSNHLAHLNYRIENDTLSMFDKSNNEPSINLPGQITIVNDSIFWLSSTPQEVLIFERVTNNINEVSFSELTGQKMRFSELPKSRRR